MASGAGGSGEVTTLPTPIPSARLDGGPLARTASSPVLGVAGSGEEAMFADHGGVPLINRNLEAVVGGSGGGRARGRPRSGTMSLPKGDRKILHSLSKAVSKLTKRVKAIETAIEALGTPKDTATFRRKFVKLCKEANAALADVLPPLFAAMPPGALEGTSADAKGASATLLRRRVNELLAVSSALAAVEEQYREKESLFLTQARSLVQLMAYDSSFRPNEPDGTAMTAESIETRERVLSAVDAAALLTAEKHDRIASLQRALAGSVTAAGSSVRADSPVPSRRTKVRKRVRVGKHLATPVAGGSSDHDNDDCSRSGEYSQEALRLLRKSSSTMLETLKPMPIGDYGVYQGLLNDDERPHGFGTLLFPSRGTLYEGEFVNGRRAGLGRLVVPGAYVFEGVFAGDVPVSSGRIVYPDGASYSGEVMVKASPAAGELLLDDYDVERSGYGAMEYLREGVVYSGMFEADALSGPGVLSALSTGASLAACRRVMAEAFEVAAQGSLVAEAMTRSRSGSGRSPPVLSPSGKLGMSRAEHDGVVRVLDSFPRFGVFYGTFAAGTLSGPGVLLCLDGSCVEAVFRDNALVGPAAFSSPLGQRVAGEIQGSSGELLGAVVERPRTAAALAAGTSAVAAELVLANMEMYEKARAGGSHMVTLLAPGNEAEQLAGAGPAGEGAMLAQTAGQSGFVDSLRSALCAPLDPRRAWESERLGKLRRQVGSSSSKWWGLVEAHLPGTLDRLAMAMAPFISSPSLGFGDRVRSLLTSLSLSPLASLVRAFVDIYNLLYGSFSAARAVSMPKGSSGAIRARAAVANAIDDLASFRLLLRLTVLEVLWMSAHGFEVPEAPGVGVGSAAARGTPDSFDMPPGWEVLSLDVLDTVLFERTWQVLSELLRARCFAANHALASKIAGFARVSLRDLGVKDELLLDADARVRGGVTDSLPPVISSMSSVGGLTSEYVYDQSEDDDQVPDSGDAGTDVAETGARGDDGDDGDDGNDEDDAEVDEEDDVDDEDGYEAGVVMTTDDEPGGGVFEFDEGLTSPRVAVGSGEAAQRSPRGGVRSGGGSSSSIFAAFDAVDSPDFAHVDFFDADETCETGDETDDAGILLRVPVSRQVVAKESTTLSDPYHAAIACMERVAHEVSPRSKLAALMGGSEAVVSAVQAAKERSGSASCAVALGAEDMFPILVYTMVKARMEEVASCIELLKLFVCEEFEGEEACYRVASLESAANFLGSLDPRVRDSGGALLPPSVLESNMVFAMYSGVTRSSDGAVERRSGQVGGVSWVVDLLQTIGYAPHLDYHYDDILFRPQWRDEVLEFPDMASSLLDAAGLELVGSEDGGGDGLLRIRFVRRYPLSVYVLLADALAAESWKDE
ncbi:MORN repeat protein [Thecamonas trahens ATCC 50062]|uniref:MORN repeat protein n=1 Tax=Thecamonas trahens ATCC 50062 TaxID=461836 RepID=A0A0L0D6Z4_THETB|nr:MORN repeat protein [Thecamonas trahens ATCC 50062]KNC48137.1 MORN repeat protein [Thecamonas trahens ATCC 50062]|eukprot:XP_013758707.1 MORN repeat protein [Thecamonas trahens ATCC 50062]